MGSARRKPILIVGGGLGGLTAALALIQRGFEVRVFEQAAELREVGAGVQISTNGSRALHALGVGAAVEREACEASGKEIRLWSTGQTWSSSISGRSPSPATAIPTTPSTARTCTARWRRRCGGLIRTPSASVPVSPTSRRTTPA